MDQPEKYQISKWTLFVDSFMSKFITVGGLSVIAAVMLILIFIGKEVVPLLDEANVTHDETIELPKVDIEDIAIDEWTLLPSLITKNSIYVINREKENAITKHKFKLDNNSLISAIQYDVEKQLVVLGNDQGKVSLVDLKYYQEPLDEYVNGVQQSNTLFSMKQNAYLELSEEGGKIVKIAANQSDTKKIVAAVIEKDGKQKLLAVTLKQSVDLFGNVSDDLAIDQRLDFTENIKGKIDKLIISSQADSLLVSTEDGTVYSFRTKNGKISFNNSFSLSKKKQIKKSCR